MTSKILEQKIRSLEQRVRELEMIQSIPSDREKHFKELEKTNQNFQKRRQLVLKKTGGVFRHLKIDPVQWQRKIRKEWDHRMPIKSK